ncbi:glycosyltransferase [Nocardia xishanensis]|uniref:Glycosyltransferase n=1 Tax=Nocardia xishanensis TaxID=238964 RepID=A0ABW7WW61_9NOCA
MNHIVLILRHFTVGGLERVLLSHVRILLDANYDVTVCVLDPGRDNALVFELPPAVRLVTAPANPLQRYVFLRQLVHDQVVILEFGDGRLYPTIRPALRAARRVIRFCHSDYSHLRNGPKNLLDRLLAAGEDRIIAVGGRSTRFLLDDVGIPGHKVATLANAVEPMCTAPEPPPWSWTATGYLVAVQSLYLHKGHDTLLRAFAEATRDRPSDVRLVIIGDGDQSIALYRLAETLNIADRVVWLGAVWHRDVVHTVLEGAAAFVSTSRFEGIPISILEARQHGLPLILTDIPGHRDGAQSGTATFVPVDDVAATAAAIRTLLAHPPVERNTDDDHIRAAWERYRYQLLAELAATQATPGDDSVQDQASPTIDIRR